MLEYTLATEFVPGSNVRGEVTGANWTFLLPSLALGRVLCWGEPAPLALPALERLADSLTICTTDARPRRAAPDSKAGWLVCAPDAPFPVADDSVDLIYVVSAPGWRGLLEDASFRAELSRVLTPHGRVYVEQRGTRARADASPGGGFGPPLRLWLTPLTGEMHTAVPLDDPLTQDFFLRRNLYSPTITVHTFKNAAKRLRRRPAKASDLAVRGSAAPTGAEGDDVPGQEALASAARRAGRWAVDSINRAEKLLHGQSGRVGRYGLLIPAAGAASLAGPPAYLRDLAHAAGVDLAGYRWGLWGGGQYSSRKVLFFLFEGQQRTPQYLVKMVRAPEFNARLENAACALRRLGELGVDSPSGTAPRLLFEGHHQGLALAAESVIEGAPFEWGAEFTPDGRHGHAAAAWLTALGAVSAQGRRVAPEEPAHVTRLLLDRFLSVYDLTQTQADFLDRQIAALSDGTDDFPVVFQHGDPGTWNMLALPDGRVAVLDWESAEVDGMPLWDVFHFLRAYVVLGARQAGESDRLRGYAQHFLDASPFSPFVIGATERYCQQVGLSAQYVEPLYYTCWMHRALKQATTLPAARLKEGYYFRLLIQSIERHEAPTLRKLFGR